MFLRDWNNGQGLIWWTWIVVNISPQNKILKCCIQKIWMGRSTYYDFISIWKNSYVVAKSANEFLMYIHRMIMYIHRITIVK